MSHQTEHKVNKVTDRITEAAESVVGTAADKAKSIGRNVGEYIDSAQDTLRKTGEDVSDAVGAVSDKVKSSANYMQEQGFAGLVDDAEVLIRRYPIHTLFLGVGLGLLIGRGRAR